MLMEVMRMLTTATMPTFEREGRHVSFHIIAFCFFYFGWCARLKWEERLEGSAPSTVKPHSLISMSRIMQIQRDPSQTLTHSFVADMLPPPVNKEITS